MKAMSTLEVYQSIRKPLPPLGKIERPVKGGGYRRRNKHRKDFLHEIY